MNYTDDTEQIVFLRDADIASSLDGKTVSGKTILSNGLPSFDLFKGKYEELSTYDNNVCAYIRDSVEVSVHNLCTEISDLRDEAKTLSTNICVSVDYISSFVRNTISADLYTLSAGTAATSTLLSNQIIALWDDVRGGVNYKGHLYNFEDTKPFGRNLDLSGIFALKYNLYDTEHWTLSANKTFNNGWLYNVTLTGGEYVTNDGVKIENNDYFIIHNHDLSCVDVSCIDRSTIDIIEAVQDDYVRFALLKQISDYLSTDYVAKIGALSDALSGVVKLSVGNLLTLITDNVEDITFLSDNLSTEVKRNLDSVHYKKDVVVNSADHTIRTTLKRTFGAVYEFRVGYLVRFPQVHTVTNEDASWKYDFEENDFILFRKDCTTETVDETCFDIIKDYDVDINYLSTYIKNTISSDLYNLSSEVSSISTDICISANLISTALKDISVGLSTYIDNLELSVNGISTIVNQLCSALSDEISSNNVDIVNILNYISGDNSLCTELADVEYHYNRTFTEQHYTKGGSDIDVDVLNVVNSEDLELKFVLIYLSGTMVLSAL